jgi:hypothetical protein
MANGVRMVALSQSASSGFRQKSNETLPLPWLKNRITLEESKELGT